MAFYPQEDAERLSQMRANLTPFLKVVSKALSSELETQTISFNRRKALFAEIVQHLPAENSTNQDSYTLQLEFVQLLNLQ